jgi:leucyl aminopeptidase
MEIKLIQDIPENSTLIYLTGNTDQLQNLPLHADEISYIKNTYDSRKNNRFYFNRFTHFICVQILVGEGEDYQFWQRCRTWGDIVAQYLAKQKKYEAVLIPMDIDKKQAFAFMEGMALGAYRFDKYKSPEDETIFNSLLIQSSEMEPGDVKNFSSLVEACYIARDLVNEPANELSAVRFAGLAADYCRKAGAEAKVFDKQQIEKLGMTGLMTVNKGSKDEPAFVTLEWKPGRPVNNKPIVLIGKGLVYDTGGINLKPGAGLAAMKCDMAGGAAVLGAIYAVVKNKLPVHIVGLIPATDNRPGESAMVPGDIIRMANGKSVEILNTDAEGRLILADALLYAKKYDPQLVIDIATLTGSAANAIGRYGVVAMHNTTELQMDLLKASGHNVFERVVEFPFWEEYDHEVVSDIADIRNLGKSREAGAITAGKFLAHFVDYPWIHIDIAGMAFLDARESYLGKGGTGVGVRLLYDFILKQTEAARL